MMNDYYITIFFRCVPDDLKALGLGLQWVCLRLLGLFTVILCNFYSLQFPLFHVIMHNKSMKDMNNITNPVEGLSFQIQISVNN